MVGDMMDFMTNGYLTSFPHRVINNGNKRFSAPFFMNLDFDVKIKVLAKFREFKSNEARQKNNPKQIIVGHHLLGQLYRDFPYILNQLESWTGLCRMTSKLSFILARNVS